MILSLALILVDKADVLPSASESSDFATVLIEAENFAFSMPEPSGQLPRQTNFTSSLRTFAQAGRQNQPHQNRHGFTMTKSGKSMNVYTTSLFFQSILNFPSGLNESSHHLISLRKLII